MGKINSFGIPCFKSANATLTTTELTFAFDQTAFFANNFVGVVAVNIVNEFEAPTDAVPIYFSTSNLSGSSEPLIGFDGEAVTTGTWTGTGVHLVFLDKVNNKLQLLV